MSEQCDHKGFHNPSSQNVLISMKGAIVICTHNCQNCGHNFVTQIEIELPGAESAPSSIITPDSKLKIQ